MRLPRLTIKRSMLAVAVVAFGLRLTITALHVAYDPECRWVEHEWESRDGPDEGSRQFSTGNYAPFWPQYWRVLLGRPWPGTYRFDRDDVEPPSLRSGDGIERIAYHYGGSRAVSRDGAVKYDRQVRIFKDFGIDTVGPFLGGPSLGGDSPRPPDRPSHPAARLP